MLKKIAVALLFFPCALLANNGMYRDDNNDIDASDGVYFCKIYPSDMLDKFDGFPSGSLHKAMFSIESTKEGKYITAHLYPDMAFDIGPNVPGTQFAAELKLYKKNKANTTYTGFLNSNNYAFYIASEKYGLAVRLKSDQAFTAMDVVLGKCERMNAY
ncbi:MULTISPECIES: hypothetical protein [Photorhabdus]|uniref:Uncharacterized protein n=2 Tax=Photorhabdus TaxID=29487 RepID=A0A7X5TJZ1_9GAMM|nr:MULTISPECIES: hypothetical protein [Photorhabdus]KER03390.1 hypothetical protein MEG1DRAFT_01865 [Photorhabdus temperata subsp. temperata Meg1]NHB94427.1 hypothetical protein [Photorhabdus cinerea]